MKFASVFFIIAGLIVAGVVVQKNYLGKPGGASSTGEQSGVNGAENATGDKTAQQNSAAGANSAGANTAGAQNTAGANTTGAQNATGANGLASNSNAQNNSQNAGAEKVAALPAPKPENNCFAFEYKHKPAAKQKDIEDFLDYTNAFPIAHKNYNPKSLCVKVNKQPVAYKLSQNKGQQEVVLGSVVGPDSVIRVSYCIGTANCKEGCAQPQKRFMDDLVSDAGGDEDFNDSWGDSNTKEKSAEQKKKLHAQVKEFRSVASENDSLTKQTVMRDWITLNQQDSFCKLSKEGK